MKEISTLFKLLFTQPVFAEDVEKNRKAGLLHTMLLLFAGAVIVIVVSGWLNKDPRVDLYAVLLISFCILIWLQVPMRRGQIYLASTILVALITTVVAATLVISGTTRLSSITYLILIVVMAGLLISRRAAVVSATINAILFTVVYIAEHNRWLSPPITVSPLSQILVFLLFLLITIILISKALQDIDENQKLAKREITERKKMEEKALAGEIRLRALVENTPDFILEVNRQGDITYINRYAGTYLGQNFREVLPVDQHQRVNDAIEKAFATGESQIFELQTIAPNGQYTWDSVRMGPIKQNGKVISLTIIMTDITVQKSAEIKMKESEERYRLISSITSDYTFSTKLDLDGNMSLNWVAGAFESITGYTYNEYKEHGGWLAHLHPDDVEKDRLALEKLKTNQIIIHEIRTFTKNKELQWVRVYAHPVWDEEANRLVGIVGAVQNITDHKRAEYDLQVSEQKFSKAFRSSPDSVTISDLHSGLLVEVNDGFQKVFGYTPEEARGRTTVELRLYKNPADRKKMLQLLTEEKHIRNLELVGQKKDGSELIAQLSVEPIEINGEPHLVTITRDITQSKLTEMELQKSTKRLELLHEIDHAMLSAQSLEDIANGALSRIWELIPCLRASVTIFDLNKQEASFLAAKFQKPTSIPKTPISFREFGQDVIDTLGRGKPWFMNNVLTDPRAIELDKKLADESGIHAWLSLPLIYQGQLIGALNLGRGIGESFIAEDAEIVREVANQLAIALQQSRLRDALQNELMERKQAQNNLLRRAEQLETLNEVGRIISSLQNLDDVLENIYQQTRRVASVDLFYISLYDENSNQVSYPILYDSGIRYTESTQSLEMDSRIGQVIFTGQPYKSHRTVDELQQPIARPMGNAQRKSASVLMVPLRLRNKIIGVLSIQSYTMNAYTDDIVEILTGIGYQAAIAIENARLFANLQQELRERQLIDSELEKRNAELERLAYTLSHEMKSPLITIRGFIGYIRADIHIGDQNRLDRDIQRITEAADRMLRLINELIDLMTIGRINRVHNDISLRGLVDEAVELNHEGIAQKNIAMDITDNLPNVRGDRKLLLEVFQSLIENSVKFMGEQPMPCIEIGQRGGKDLAPTFYVRDNGIGIDSRFADRVFNIFEKLDVQSEGTGVGLAIVKRIIEVHGGKIWVESEGPGKGSTFFFTLPNENK